jgi:hypothetical protein
MRIYKSQLESKEHEFPFITKDRKTVWPSENLEQKIINLILSYNNWKYMNYSECFGVYYKNQVPGVKYKVTKEFVKTEEELIIKYLKLQEDGK